MFTISEVDLEHAPAIEKIRAFNGLSPDVFPELKDKHLNRGFWWFAYDDKHKTIGFAGMVPFDPFQNIGYLKRAYVAPEYRGNGLQWQFMTVREAKAKEIGWTQLVSECVTSNIHSANNFIKAGFKLCDPEQPWSANSLYWTKTL